MIDRDAVAETAAKLLMEAVFRFRKKGAIHLSVLTESRKARPTMLYEWQLANMFGVSFARRDAAAAEAWVIEAIRAGYRPLYHFRKRGSGYCPNEVCKLLDAQPPAIARPLPVRRGEEFFRE